MPYLFTLLDYLKLNYIYYPIIMMIVTAVVYKYSYDMLITNIVIVFFIMIGYFENIFPLYLVYTLFLLLMILVILSQQKVLGLRV